MSMNRIKYTISLITVFFLTASTSTSFAQLLDSVQTKSNDSLNLQSIVQKQIETAKLKNSIPVILNTAEESTTPVKKTIVVKSNPVNTSTSVSSEWTYKGIIMFIGTAAVFVWLGFRRRKRNKILKTNSLKENIKLMREEKFIKEIDPKLKDIRTKLILTSVVLNEDKIINAAARKSQIGKEEIILASRIRSREMQFNRQRSFA